MKEFCSFLMGITLTIFLAIFIIDKPLPVTVEDIARATLTCQSNDGIRNIKSNDSNTQKTHRIVVTCGNDVSISFSITSP